MPVSVMSCKVMLVLCGSTYPCRLWCIWELFTLMAFVPMAEVLERLHLVALHPSTPAPSPDSVAEQLCRFNVADAHCYDPNEEARLLTVIGARQL